MLSVMFSSPLLRRACLFAAAVAAAGCAAVSPVPADLVVTNARIWTSEADTPWVEALAVRGERIVAVGDSDAMRAYVGAATEVVDSPPGMIVPGFIDTHVHFLDGGFALSSVQLRDAASRAEFVARIAAYAATLQPGEWILNGDWDHENWGGALPTRDWIDAVTPDNPMMINRLDGHMVLINGAAMERAGIDAATAEVDGGEIVRDAGGKPTGVLKDNAMSLVQQVVPPRSTRQLDRALASASAYVAANGVTSVHDMADWHSLATYRRAHERGVLATRIYSVVPLADWARLAAEVEQEGNGDAWLRIGGLKGFMDGSLGSHTAAFFEPFTDAPGDRGLLINDLADMRRWIVDADAAGLHLNVHAIGDRAISELLDIFAEAVERNGLRDRRLRMEHAQHVRPDDIERFAEQDVIASMQPYHAIDDGRWAEKVIGAERIRTTYAFRSLLDSGARVAFGSDWSVAPAEPLQGIYAAVTRRTLDGAHPDGWVPQEKIRVEDALIAYTRTAAFASFEEDTKGTVAPGKLADLVFLDADLMRIDPVDIRDVRVLRTIIGGRTVYRAAE